LKIDHGCVDPKSAGQLTSPLFPQSGRGQDQDSFGDATRLELTDDEARLNRLPESHIVCQEQSGAEASNHCQRGFQLVGQEIDSGPSCGAETSGGRMRRKYRSAAAPPEAWRDKAK
jgi:hypothetical protein